MPIFHINNVNWKLFRIQNSELRLSTINYQYLFQSTIQKSKEILQGHEVLR